MPQPYADALSPFPNEKASMNAPVSDTHDDDVLVPIAAWEISRDAGRPTSDQAVRRAARRIGALRVNAHGRYTLPRSILNEMIENFRRSGYLLRRGQRSVEVYAA